MLITEWQEKEIDLKVRIQGGEEVYCPICVTKNRKGLLTLGAKKKGGTFVMCKSIGCTYRFPSLNNNLFNYVFKVKKYHIEEKGGKEQTETEQIFWTHASSVSRRKINGRST